MVLILSVFYYWEVLHHCGRSFILPFTVVSSGIISTLVARSGEIVTCHSVAVTFTSSTVRETIVAWFTYVTLSLSSVRNTQTLSIIYITEVVSSTDGMTVAGCKTNKLVLQQWNIKVEGIIVLMISMVFIVLINLKPIIINIIIIIIIIIFFYVNYYYHYFITINFSIILLTGKTWKPIF